MTIDAGLFTAGLIVILIAFLFIHHSKKRWPSRNFPPGPIGIPFVGSILSLSPNVHLDLNKYKKRYGDIFSLMLGDLVVVAVNNATLVKEILRRTETSNRIFFWSESQFSNPHREGVFDLLYGDKWQTQRTFAVNTLRGFGFGKRCMEYQTAEEVKTMISELKKQTAKVVDMRMLICTSVSNVMCKLIYNQRFDHNDEEFRMILDLINKVFLIQGRAYDFLPIARLFQKKTIAADRELWKTFYAYIERQIKVHRQTYQADDTRDFIDAAIAQEEIDPVNFNNEELKLNITNLFMAGTETTSSTLSWAILYMGLNPDIQENVFLEIERVVGLNRSPELKDQSDLPYTMAVIYETQRIGSVVPFIARWTSEDISVGGYNIPKGTTVIANMWGLHHNDDIWQNPSDFVPERFLDDHGKVSINENLLAFGGGRRVCMGMSLAKMELFLFFTFLIQQFKFDFPSDSPPPSLDGELGITLMPKQYKIRLTCR